MNSQISKGRLLPNYKRSSEMYGYCARNLMRVINKGIPGRLFLDDLYGKDKIKSMSYTQISELLIPKVWISSQVDEFIYQVGNFYRQVVLMSLSNSQDKIFFNNWFLAIEKHAFKWANGLQNTKDATKYAKVYNDWSRDVLSKILGMVKCTMIYSFVHGEPNWGLGDSYKTINSINNLYYHRILPLLAVYDGKAYSSSEQRRDMWEALMKVEIAFHRNFFTKGVGVNCVSWILENLIWV